VKISRFYILGIMQVSGDKQKENVGTKGAERVVKPGLRRRWLAAILTLSWYVALYTLPYS
jgi:hypothetical protein